MSLEAHGKDCSGSAMVSGQAGPKDPPDGSAEPGARSPKPEGRARSPEPEARSPEPKKEPPSAPPHTGAYLTAARSASARGADILLHGRRISALHGARRRLALPRRNRASSRSSPFNRRLHSFQSQSRKSCHQSRQSSQSRRPSMSMVTLALLAVDRAVVGHPGEPVVVVVTVRRSMRVGEPARRLVNRHVAALGVSNQAVAARRRRPRRSPAGLPVTVSRGATDTSVSFAIGRVVHRA